MEKNKIKINLTTKAIIGVFGLIISFLVLLFLPSLSFRYWKAWIYFCLWVSFTVFLTIYFMRKDQNLIAGRLTGIVGEKEKIQKIIKALAYLFFIIMLVIPSLDHRFNWSCVPNFLSILGDVFVILAFIVIFFVYKENTYASAIIEIQNGQKVITTGPYRHVRHPLYSGSLLLVLFTPIALGSYWGLVSVLPLFAIVTIRIHFEEKYLSKNLLGYKEYCQKVRYRLIPLVF